MSNVLLHRWGLIHQQRGLASILEQAKHVIDHISPTFLRKLSSLLMHGQ
jgi:hypothetical protein